MTQPGSQQPTANTPFWGKCDACEHCWVVAYYPIDARTFAQIVAGHSSCPKCGVPGMVAKQDNGTLQEEGIN